MTKQIRSTAAVRYGHISRLLTVPWIVSCKHDNCWWGTIAEPKWMLWCMLSLIVTRHHIEIEVLHSIQVILLRKRSHDRKYNLKLHPSDNSMSFLDKQWVRDVSTNKHTRSLWLAILLVRQTDANPEKRHFLQCRDFARIMIRKQSLFLVCYRVWTLRHLFCTPYHRYFTTGGFEKAHLLFS